MISAHNIFKQQAHAPTIECVLYSVIFVCNGSFERHLCAFVHAFACDSKILNHVSFVLKGNLDAYGDMFQGVVNRIF